jgi:hypothetical protein
MTVLHFDPPPRALRLVATGANATERDRRYRNGARLFGDARALYGDVLRESLSSGQAIDPDALRVVLAALQTSHAGPIRRFTGSLIWQLLFVDVITWCRNRHLNPPEGCVEALAATIRYLELSGTLDPLGDHIDELYDALDDCTGGWSERTQRPTPGGVRGSLPSKRGPKRR